MTHTAEATMTKRSRPAYTTRARQTVQALTSGRTAQRQAREYAELWHQALKAWDVEVPRPITPVVRYGPGGSFDLSTLGEHLPDLPTALVTPDGEHRENEVGQIIDTLLNSGVPDAVATGQLLERYRRELPTPASLTDEGGGWAYPRARSIGYAVACLTLATRLNVRHPDLPRHLQACRQALVGVEVAETPTSA